MNSRGEIVSGYAGKVNGERGTRPRAEGAPLEAWPRPRRGGRASPPAAPPRPSVSGNPPGFQPFGKLRASFSRGPGWMFCIGMRHPRSCALGLSEPQQYEPVAAWKPRRRSYAPPCHWETSTGFIVNASLVSSSGGGERSAGKPGSARQPSR